MEADSPRAKIAKGNELFHADSSFNDLPSKWSMLRGVIVTPERGETETIDMRAVYDALPEAMKQRVTGLRARHNYFHSRRKAGAEVDDSNHPLAPYMRAEHPLVRPSASGRPALVQETGLSSQYPTGEGLVTFTDLDSAAEGAERILRDYARHAAAARALAEEYFDSDRVLRALLKEAGVGRQAVTA